MATTQVSRLYRGASCRTHIACGAGAPGWLERLLFLPRFPSILRRAAPTLPADAAHRTRQDIACKARGVGDRCQSYRRIQRHQRVLHGISQDHRPDPERLSPKLLLGVTSREGPLRTLRAADHYQAGQITLRDIRDGPHWRGPYHIPDVCTLHSLQIPPSESSAGCAPAAVKPDQPPGGLSPVTWADHRGLCNRFLR